MLGSADGASSVAKVVPHGGDLLHERDVRGSEALVLLEQNVRLLDLHAYALLERRGHVRGGGQGGGTVALEVVARERRMLAEVVGVGRGQAARVSEVIEVVRGQARRRLPEFVEMVRREVVVGVMKRRRVRVVPAAVASASGEGGGQRVTVTTGHPESPEP